MNTKSKIILLQITMNHFLLAQAGGAPSFQPVISVITPIFYVLALIAIGHGAYEIHEKRDVRTGLISLLVAFLLAAAITIVKYIFLSQGESFN